MRYSTRKLHEQNEYPMIKDFLNKLYSKFQLTCKLSMRASKERNELFNKNSLICLLILMVLYFLRNIECILLSRHTRMAL